MFDAFSFYFNYKFKSAGSLGDDVVYHAAEKGDDVDSGKICASYEQYFGKQGHGGKASIASQYAINGEDDVDS